MLSNVMHPPSHHQAGPLVINTQLTLRATPALCDTISLAVFFGSNGNSYTISTQADMCVYVHTYSSQYRDAGWPNEIKKHGTAVNVACQGILSACHASADLDHGPRTPCLPGCLTGAAATIVNYVHTISIAQ